MIALSVSYCLLGRAIVRFGARVLEAFLAEADRAAAERPADAAPPFRPHFFAGAFLAGLPLPALLLLQQWGISPLL
jgi:hypothetical protein